MLVELKHQAPSLLNEFYPVQVALTNQETLPISDIRYSNLRQIWCPAAVRQPSPFLISGRVTLMQTLCPTTVRKPSPFSDIRYSNFDKNVVSCYGQETLPFSDIRYSNFYQNLVSCCSPLLNKTEIIGSSGPPSTVILGENKHKPC